MTAHENTKKMDRQIEETAIKVIQIEETKEVKTNQH